MLSEAQAINTFFGGDRRHYDLFRQIADAYDNLFAELSKKIKRTIPSSQLENLASLEPSWVSFQDEPHEYQNWIDKHFGIAKFKAIGKITEGGLWYPTPLYAVYECIYGLAQDFKVPIQDYVFVDNGTGDGRVPIVATGIFGMPSIGIDVDNELLAIAEDMKHRLSASVDLDGLAFQRQDFLSFDYTAQKYIVFHFGLLEHNPSEVKLLRKMDNELPEGSYVIFFKFTPDPNQFARLKRIEQRRAHFTYVEFYQVK